MLRNNIISTIISSAALWASLSFSPASAQEREEVLRYVNGILSYWEHSTSLQNQSGITVDINKLRYSYSSWSFSWCRRYGYSFNPWNIHTGVCISGEHESHELSYQVLDTQVWEVRIWWWVKAFSNIEWEAELHIFHPLVGSYSWQVSQDISEVLYDPFISFSFSWEYPIQDNIQLYGWWEYKHGVYSHSWDIYVWLEYSPNDQMNAFWNIWHNTFGFHWNDVRARTVDLLLWNTWSYIELWWEYCPTDNVCLRASANHTLSGAWEWNTNTFAHIGINF